MKHYSLLIVDDEQRFADMLARRLNLRGCNCEVCYRGQEALNILKQKNFDLILLDLHLPDIYGTKVLARIKKIYSKTPVIIVTAHGTEKDEQECIQQGAYAFMHKPLGIVTIMSILAQLREMSA
ncbi:MAG: response regulator [Deltaproteobacteria bacterium]|jgi:DNA-binding NtrC family response regulator|nr:response regulator [Deltaproteobacteria bacterium]